MTQETHSLVQSTKIQSVHRLYSATYLLTNTTLLDTKVLMLMTQDYLSLFRTMYRAIGQDTFQPRIGFKTRYGMVLNPFAKGLVLQTLIAAQTLVLTLTTEELELLTLCNPVSGYTEITLQGAFRPFFYAKL